MKMKNNKEKCVLVIGASSSGKSNYTEMIAQKILEKEMASPQNITYIATMKDDSFDAHIKIKKHKDARDKELFDLELAFSIEELLEIAHKNKNPIVVLDCMSVFVSNILFENLEKNESNKESIQKSLLICGIMYAIRILLKSCKYLFIVADMAFYDCHKYNFEIDEWQKFCGEILKAISNESYCVIEVVCGIPLMLKGYDYEKFEVQRDSNGHLYKDTNALC